jgi:hypothetical protein
MRKAGEKLRLGAFFNPTGHHVASWRHPQSQADAGVNFDHYVELARTAERAKMDMVIPELQRRGLFRTEYEGRTLRENLGLARPESRYLKGPSVVAAE